MPLKGSVVRTLLWISVVFVGLTLSGSCGALDA
jgi:hypothetical protein